ncbi:Imm53 family immunity protein [Cognatishimia sp. D5M38]|uniref:Imm53 family immunity protein n=1 Tax=Cognatishimia coralii TaxID=3083254 RepID=A0ABU8QI59_9RHOB
MKFKEMNIDLPLIKLQNWYVSNCDGDWEHTYGFKLETLDNPGWTITVDLDETHQEDQDFTESKINYEHKTRWLVVSKEGSKLKGACGPLELETMLVLVAEWLQPRE